eukprot:scaffold47358_cov66-Phaeocystis_antarctica.AAC.1
MDPTALGTCSPRQSFLNSAGSPRSRACRRGTFRSHFQCSSRGASRAASALSGHPCLQPWCGSRQLSARKKTPASSYSRKDTIHARDGAHSGDGTVAPCGKLVPLARRAAKCGMRSAASCAPSQSHRHWSGMRRRMFGRDEPAWLSCCGWSGPSTMALCSSQDLPFSARVCVTPTFYPPNQLAVAKRTLQHAPQLDCKAQHE